MVAGFRCVDGLGNVLGDANDPDTRLAAEGQVDTRLDSLQISTRKTDVLIHVSTAIPTKPGCLFEAGARAQPATFVGVVAGG